MTGCQFFGRNDVVSRQFVCIIILVMGGFGAALGATTLAMAPNSTNTSVEEEGCFRALVDVIWGFLVTLLALTISLWGSAKYYTDGKERLLTLVLSGLFLPIIELQFIVERSFWFGMTLWKCQRTQEINSKFSKYSWFKLFCLSLKPWSKSVVRILASCNIVMYITKDSPLLEEEWLWEEEIIDESEAMVIVGNGVRSTLNDNYKNMVLSREGSIAFMWKEVFLEGDDSKCLPKYERLKFLRGNLGFAIIAIAVQALGYIYAIGYRSAKNLRVSPLEVIGLILNIILLIKASLFSTCNPCHRPLVIYMTEEWEKEFWSQLRTNDGKKSFGKDHNKRAIICIVGITSGVVLCTSIILIHYIVNIMNHTSIMIVFPLILFLLGIVFGFIFLTLFIVVDNYDIAIFFRIVVYLAIIVNAIAYIWALVVTVWYWKSKQFNARAELVNLSQLIPFIG